MIIVNEAVTYAIYAIVTDAYNKQEAFDKLSKREKFKLISYISNSINFPYDKLRRDRLEFFSTAENVEIYNEYFNEEFVWITLDV